MIKNLKRVHIEASGRCNARCPMCSRHTYMGYIQPKRVQFDLSPKIFYKFFTEDRTKNLDHVYFSGVYGDPCMNKQLPEFINWLQKWKKGNVSVDSNAGYRSPSWWEILGKMKPKINFAIDGLEDTNHIYRRNVVWKKVWENINAFQRAGGNGQWNFIVFKHNEHQIEEAKKLAYKLGFHNFIWEPSVRHYSPEEDTFIKTEGIGELVPDVPTVTKQKNVRYEAIKSAKAISCKVLKKKMMYITHDFKLLPCCYFHSWQVIDDYLKFIGKSEDARTYFVNFNNDLNQRSLETIMEDEFFNKIISDWNSCKPDVCANNCNQNEYWNKEKYNDEISSNKI